jgi:hypothetical protein
MLEKGQGGVQNLYYICEETRATNRHGSEDSGEGGRPGLANKIGGRRERKRVQNKLKETGQRQGSARMMCFVCAAIQRCG